MKKPLYTILICTLLLSMGCKDSAKSKEAPLLDSDPQHKNEGIPTPTSKIETNIAKVNPIKIIPIEHATAVIEWKQITIYVDPVGGADAFKDQKQPDLILITDIHGDHFDLATLTELNTSKAKIIVPNAVADKMPSEFNPQIDILYNGDSKNRYGINVEAIPMYNLREEAKKFHEKGRGNGYVINIGGQRLYFSGDTEDIPEMRALTNIDMAFVCMNLPYTMTVTSAAEAVLEFKPKEVYPYHYRGRPDVSDVTEFKQLVNAGDPNIKVVQLDWYPNDTY